MGQGRCLVTCVRGLESPVWAEHGLKAPGPCLSLLQRPGSGYFVIRQSEHRALPTSQDFPEGLPDSLSLLGPVEPKPVLGAVRMLMVMRTVTQTRGNID